MNIIELPSQPQDALDWKIGEGRDVLWHFCFGDFCVEDEFRFQTSCLALKHFTKEVWPQVQAKTAGCILYKGPVEGMPDILYFQMLAHKLPDELPIFLLLDDRESSVADVLKLLNNDRFSHFSVGFRTDRIPRDGFVWDEAGVRAHKVNTTVGVVLPETSEELQWVTQFSNVKVLFERTLTEEWDGLDQLIVDESKMSEQGLRKLKGFVAAGGEIRGRGI